jgi:serpin B
VLPAAAVAVALAATGCASAAAPRPPVKAGPVAVLRGVASRVPAADPRPYGAADTVFGLDVLRAWCRAQPRSNIVFSPASLATGLGMAYPAAGGATAAAMARVLHLPAAGGKALEAGMRARWAAITGLDRPGVTLDGSNRVWSDPSLLPRRSYLNAVATADGAGLSRAPVLSQPERARQMINATIAADTRGHIPALLPPGSLTADAWVLTSALYLNATWATPFGAGQTRPGPFTTAAGRQATAQFMHGSGYRYATVSGWTAVALPYRGGGLAMTALLPPSGGGAAGCQIPAAAVLGTLSKDLRNPGAAAGTAGVALPKVSLSSHQDMKTLLTGLGMGVAFSTAADFTGLSPQACCISTVQHAATLRVAEKGTVGSAATGVGIAMSAGRAVREPQVAFSRPYLMLITGTATGEPLFLARVADPAAP